ncbi:RteC domain-containing protein [Chryseobacterium oryctis]|uniref:RteC domain-containing protein n=1 Tax=Chryseobacterium oryctis TaxID=2952618 RepID=A0ABT3HNE5_9FLAO|nr:RteC domain-containing protein [Chryseobacterium oryctis]MCW3161315.1 RteC domain-containing protein [Chryseobacterium oryctis]
MYKIEILLLNLAEQLNFIDIEVDDILLKCEKSVEITVKAIQVAKREILRTTFKSDAEEINFFKEIKPQFTSKRIYYNSVYRIETKKPSGSIRVLKKYYNNELEKLKRYFDDNLDFYKYYRTKSTYLDYKYFVRGTFDVKQNLDNFYYEADLKFTTSHDFKVAKIMANDLIQVYLEDQLSNLDRKENRSSSEVLPKSAVYWTSTKVSLIELIYAINAAGVLNHGQLELNATADFFEKVFNIDLGQYHRSFLELRERKNARTKFLDFLKEVLTRKMDDADELL